MTEYVLWGVFFVMGWAWGFIAHMRGTEVRDSVRAYSPTNATPSTPRPWGEHGPAGKPTNPDEPNPRLIVSMEPWSKP